MITVFLIYSVADSKEANKIQANLIKQDTESNGPSIRVLMNHHTPNDWKSAVQGMIQEAQAVLFVQGQNSAESESIRWEVESALRAKKPFLVYPLGEYPLPEWLMKTTLVTPFFESDLREKVVSSFFLGGFLNALSVIPFLPISIERDFRTKLYIVRDLSKIKKKLVQLVTGQYDVFSKQIQDSSNPKSAEASARLFEQYKLYQQTSENLTQQEQKTNEFFLSINTALLTFSGAVIGFSDMPAENKFLILLVAMLAGILFNRAWCRKIEQLKIINRAKMRMLNLIEQNLPLRLFDEEYVIMKDDPSGPYKNTVADKEAVPHSFNFLYGLIVVLFAVFSLFSKS